MMRIARPAVLAVALLAGACVSGPQEPLADLKPGERPDIESDEAGLWMQMDGVEEKLSTSGRVVTDPKLNQYVRDVTCRLSQEYCKDLRLYIVQTPHFNASMAPNGTMQVWTGTLLRVQNEAQLAFVLSHEMGHYVRRHSVQQWRRIRSSSDRMAFFTVTTRMAGLGFVGDLADLAALSGVMAFSRDHERESDEIGFEMTANAGYAAGEAPKIWENILAEREAAGKEKPSVFFSSHPPGEERIETLRQRAAAAGTGGEDRRRQFLAAIAPHRGKWLRDEVRKRDFEGTETLLANLLADGYRPGEIHYYQGEIHRLRGEDGDLTAAISSYRKALASKGAPAETHRELGLVYWKTKHPKLARKSFRAYLAAAPKAEDRAMVKSYIQQLK
jgi:hypothetical protein